jgi:hypothetical protein
MRFVETAHLRPLIPLHDDSGVGEFLHILLMNCKTASSASWTRDPPPDVGAKENSPLCELL